MATSAVRQGEIRKGAAASFQPLGLRLEVDAGDPALLAHVADALRGWEGDRAESGPALRLGLREAPSLAGSGGVGLRVERGCLFLRGPGADGWADSSRGAAECRLSADYRGDPERLRDDILDPLLLFLLTHRGRTPVHAAAITIGGLAVLLAGPSGSGKSCLALAAAGAGLPVLSDDTVYVQRDPDLRIWGIPRPVHVYPADAPAPAAAPLRHRNGKLKQAVSLPPAAAAATAERAVLCVLGRGAEAALKPLSSERACALLEPIEPGFDLLAAEVRAAHSLLAANGAWLLELSRDPAAAIRLLRERCADLERTAAP